MKIAIVFFAYGGDADLLGFALRGVERIKRHISYMVDIDVYVYDQDTNPLPTIPHNVLYTQTTFNRRGNLNGLECIKGMASIYAHLGKTYDWIVKVDCDVVLNDLDWVLAFDPSSTSQVGYNTRFKRVRGGCYAFSADGARLIFALLEKPSIQEKIALGHGCEDVIFDILAKESGLPQAIYKNAGNRLGMSRGAYHDFVYPSEGVFVRAERPNKELMKSHMACVFKRMASHRTQQQRELDHIDAVKRMGAYIDWLEKERY